MTSSVEPTDLLSFATPYALHALTDSDAADIDRRVAAAPPDVAEAFAAEVLAVRETMAVIASATAVEPPTALREQVLREIAADSVRPLPRRSNRTRIVLAAAAAVVVGLGALGVGLALRPAPAPSTAEQVFAAPDVRSVTGDIPGGGTATLMFSRERHSGVLVMNNVPPPQPGTVYQMWLVGADGPKSAGVMDAASVAPSTTAVLPDLGSSQALALTVEPPGGSAQPTTPVLAQLSMA